MLITKVIKFSKKYLDFSNIFLKEKTMVLAEITNLNQYIIKLQKNYQLFYKLIYSLKTIELEKLKIYIKINLVNNFIMPLILFVNIFILII